MRLVLDLIQFPVPLSQTRATQRFSCHQSISVNIEEALIDKSARNVVHRILAQNIPILR